MSSNIFQIKGIGTVRVKTHPSSKRIKLSVRQSEVLVTYPPYTPFETVRKFVNDHLDWIREHKKKLEQKSDKIQVFTPETQFSTRHHKLEIEEGTDKTTNIQIQNGKIYVSYPKGIETDHPQVQEHIRYAIEEALRLEAKTFLPERVLKLAEEHGFKYNRVFIKNNKTNWGSCSHVNNINLNLHLMRLPDHLIDYVILHELVHTKEKNHGSAFWAQLDLVCNNRARELSKEVKKYHPKVL